MSTENKKSIVWWLEAIRVVLAALAGILGGTAV